MEIKCKTHPNYYNLYQLTPKTTDLPFHEGPINFANRVGEKRDVFIKRPVAIECAAGLSGLNKTKKSFLSKIKTYAHNYVKNISHTYDHKIIYALIEKELFGKISIDSITHDADKLILYTLGFPKSFVSKFHRKHSSHHPESGKKMNLKSMLCDNIASSPEFKPEKKLSLREHFKTCQQLQNVSGLKEILEKHNFGENIDFNKIKNLKNNRFQNLDNTLKAFCLALPKIFI